jgi:site-specific recombinase XerD
LLTADSLIQSFTLEQLIMTGTLSAEPLVDAFLEQGLYLRNWTAKTIRIYRLSLRECPDELTKASLNAVVVKMRQRGLTTGGINVRIRSINSFLSWLHDEGRLQEHLRIKVLRNSPKPIALLPDTDVRRLMQFRPKTLNERRAWTLTMLLLDSGLRIEEALSLERKNVNLDDRALRVVGKGNKERIVPISVEGRKILYRWMSGDSNKGRPDGGSSPRYVFTARSDGRLTYRNAYRDIQVLCNRASISRRVHPHAFRHCFAVAYIRQGGDIYRLSRILGHASIETTQLYVRSMGIEHLREAHEARSPLVYASIR